MAIAFIGAADLGNQATTTTFTSSYTVGSGSNRILFVGVKGHTSSDLVTGVTYAGVSMNLVDKVASGDRWIYLFSLIAPTTGANNVVVSSNFSIHMYAVAADYDGVSQTGQPEVKNTNGPTNGTSMTTSLTVATANSWAVLAFGGYDSGSFPTAGTGSTRRAYDHTDGAHGIFDSNGPLSTGSYSMTASYSGSNSENAVMASFAPAAGTSAFPYHYYQQQRNR